MTLDKEPFDVRQIGIEPVGLAAIEWPHRNFVQVYNWVILVTKALKKGSARLRQPTIFRLLPDYPRPDKCWPLDAIISGSFGDNVQRSIVELLAQPGIVEAWRKSMPLAE